MSQRSEAEARRSATRIQRALAEEIVRLRTDAGLSRALLARVAGVDPAFLRRIEDGVASASFETYARVGIALGADFSARLYPNTGPTIRDRHQATILEGLLRVLHVRWRPYPEAIVRTPVRGSVDLVLHAPLERELVAVEIESDLRRLEQTLRWSTEKAAALPSWPGWARLEDPPEASRLLVVRSTRATRAIGREFAGTLAAAFPAHPADAIAALKGTTRWPGPALVWAEIEAESVRFVARR